MSWDKEAIYDEQISPLMTQIIAICKEHNIPMVAQFQYADLEEHGPAYVTTTMPFVNERGGEGSEHLREIALRMKPPAPICLAETIVTNPDGSKQITIRRV